MRSSLTSSAVATAAFIAVSLIGFVRPTGAAEPGRAPDIYNIDADHLSPEDCAFDIDNRQWYQSNLFRGQIHIAQTNGTSSTLFIPKISSTKPFDTPYQLAGLSLDKRNAPTRLYAVAKDRNAFVFSSSDATRSISEVGPNRFVAYDLPITSESQPAWSIRLDRVQDRLKEKVGGEARPFGPVDSAQDDQGNSYVVFALGAPAIAKISPNGQKVEPWAIEMPTMSRAPRVGYTGITYDAESNKLIAYGGPRVLTVFDLSSDTPSQPIPVKIDGDLSISDITSAEKINLIPSLDGTGPRLLATNAPNVYSFRSTSSSNAWSTVSVKTTSREEFKNNGLTVVCEANFRGRTGKRERQIYAQGAYFSEGANTGRTQWPLYRLPEELLTA